MHHAKLGLILGAAIPLAVAGCNPSPVAKDAKEANSAEATPAADHNDPIASAMAAGPPAIAEGATIVQAQADGSMKTLREGKNGWTCMPDSPTTPGPDPMCMDQNAMEWINAYMAKKAPPSGKLGMMYMLAGGTDASNTDPYAQKPDSGNHWIKTGPHFMIVGADPAFYANYPKSTDPDTAAPYVMWSGTPYEHLMAPIK